MTRVSLREAYDNKDVVAQIYAIRDTAESAVDTSEQAVTTANTASDHVDALVPQVEGAVQNANSASASAQASAQTVAGYENRLGAVETGLNNVTLRVTTAEGQIVTIEGRVTALETADGQNVKINRINDYAVGLTGNQDPVTGNKMNNGGQVSSGSVIASGWSNKQNNADVTKTPSGSIFGLLPCLSDANGKLLAGIRIQTSSTNRVVFFLATTAKDGTTIKSKSIATYDRDNDTWL